jgi:hypothetical protein
LAVIILLFEPPDFLLQGNLHELGDGHAGNPIRGVVGTLFQSRRHVGSEPQGSIRIDRLRRPPHRRSRAASVGGPPNPRRHADDDPCSSRRLRRHNDGQGRAIRPGSPADCRRARLTEKVRAGFRRHRRANAPQAAQGLVRDVQVRERQGVQTAFVPPSLRELVCQPRRRPSKGTRLAWPLVIRHARLVLPLARRRQPASDGRSRRRKWNTHQSRRGRIEQ